MSRRKRSYRYYFGLGFLRRAPAGQSAPDCRVIPCATCGKSKYHETDRARFPGHYTLRRAPGWCECKD